jgi:predicted phosphodiesterase
MRSGRRRLALGLVLVVCVAVGMWGAPRLSGPRVYTTAVADVQLRLGFSAPGKRGLDFYVPLANWGLRARLVDAPLRVRAEPRRINRAGVAELVTDPSHARVTELRGELDDALGSAGKRFALYSVCGGVFGGLLALLLWHLAGVRGRRLLVAPAGALLLAAATTGGMTAWALGSFDAARLSHPDYYASGIELERILDQASALRASGRKYADRVDSALRAVAGLLNDRGEGANPLAPGGASRRIVLASDVHNNLLTLPALHRFAEGTPTILAGDFTINGGRAEAPLAARAAHVGRPVVVVSGNHDSPGILNALRREGAIVLDHAEGVRTIGGIDIAGFEDPLMLGGSEFPDGIRAGISFSDLDDGHERFVDAVRERWDWWRALPTRPDVLVVHQAAIGKALANLIWRDDPDGAPVSLLVGHTHRQELDFYGPVTVVNSGSIGAGGLFGIGSQSVGFALLDLGAEGDLEAVDLVSENPATSAARARRVIPDEPDCDGTLVVCHEEPEVLPELSSG